MTEFRKVTDRFWVSPQISVEDLAEAKAQGFQLIINNRPDGEAPDQPTSAQMGEAAGAAGLDYVFAPVVGRPGAEAVEAVKRATAASPGKALAFCRSVTRSINTWALGEAGSADRDELVRLGAAAGYDLRAVLG
jgi:uncharacterized protein (TIGR01244 family)